VPPPVACVHTHTPEAAEALEGSCRVRLLYARSSASAYLQSHPRAEPSATLGLRAKERRLLLSPTRRRKRRRRRAAIALLRPLEAGSTPEEGAVAAVLPRARPIRGVNTRRRSLDLPRRHPSHQEGRVGRLAICGGAR
jgi:hypothetical protein